MCSSDLEFAAKLDDCLRQWLVRRGFPPEPTVWDRARLGSPYPGLVAFDENRRAVFFGRRVAIEQALRRLRDVESVEAGRVPFVLLIGASGSGKSSLLRRLTGAEVLVEDKLFATLGTEELSRAA